jgi:SAM-dependent methyltransferase
MEKRSGEGPRDNPNLARFQAGAQAWDEVAVRTERAGAIAHRLAELGLLDASARVLDLGCGTGLLTMEIRGYAGKVVGVDLSPAMAERLTKKCAREAAHNVEVVVSDLENEPLPGGQYDLIVSSMTWHHIRNIDGLIERCVSSLRTHGWLAVADLDRDATGYHEDETGVVHQGFDREELAQGFRQAGLVDVRAETVLEETKPSAAGVPRHFTNFLVYGRRP